MRNATDEMAETSPPPRLVSGKYVILALLALGAVAAAASWTNYALVQRRPMRFWGTQTARLIAQAPRVEALRLEPATASKAEAESEQLAVGAQQLLVEEKHAITGRPGLGHVRTALINTKSFGPTVDMISDVPAWHYALRFTDGEQTATIVFSQDCQWTAASDGTVSASLAPVAERLAVFLREQFPNEAPPLDDQFQPDAPARE
jgi:hypothetical protein